VLSVASSPNNRYIVSGSADNEVRIWDLNTGKCIKIFIVNQSIKDHTNPVNSVAFSADGGRVVSASDDGRVLAWDVKEYNELCIDCAADELQKDVKEGEKKEERANANAARSPGSAPSIKGKNYEEPEFIYFENEYDENAEIDYGSDRESI